MKVKNKTCNFCSKSYPATKQYFNLSYNRQGLNSKCKKCTKTQKKKYKYTDKEDHTLWLNGFDEIYI